MTARLIVTREADDDLVDAARWYDQHRSGLGHELLVEVRQAITMLRERPEAFPRALRTMRRALVHRFPYVIYFTHGDGVVVVVAILHERQDHRSRLKGR